MLFDGEVSSVHLNRELFSSNPLLPDSNTHIVEELVHWVANPKQLDSDHYLLETAVTDYTLRHPDGSVIDLSLSAVPIDIRLPFSNTPNPHHPLAIACHWYDSTAQAWTTSGCVTLEADPATGLHCRCNHLS